MTQAWDGNAFRCHYTGIALVDDDHTDPRYITFDHRTPRVETDIVLAAAFINDMKSDLTEDEFKSVVLALARRFSGEGFDESIVAFRHWRRGPRRMAPS